MTASAPSSPKYTPADGPRRPRRWPFVVLAVVVLVGIAGGALFAIVPYVLRSRIVAAARDAGVHLTIARVRIGLSGVSLDGVDADVPAVPGIRAHAEQIVARGLYATNVRVLGGSLDIDGSAALVDQLRTLAQERTVTPFDTRSRTIDVVSARIAWRGLFGKDSSVEAGGVEASATVVGNTVESVQTNLGRFEVTAAGKVLGPWSSNVDASPSAVDVTLLFDPEQVDGPKARAHFDGSLLSSFHLDVPRTTFDKLGIRLADLGAAFDPASDVQATIEATTNAEHRVDASGTLAIHRVHAQGISAPIDVNLSAAASGKLGEPLALRNTTVGFGPFRANVKGTLTPRKGGFRVDTTYEVEPVRCADLIRQEAEKMGKLVSLVQDIAQSTGAARVSGNVEASGIFEFDSQNPGAAALTLRADNACSFSLFGN